MTADMESSITIVTVYALLFVTRFHITQLPHTQNQPYDFTRNGLLVQYTFTLHSVFPRRMAIVIFVADPVKATSG